MKENFQLVLCKIRLSRIWPTRGFPISDAKSAFDELDSQVDEETTQELIFKELDKQYAKYVRKYEGYELKQRLTQVLARKGYVFRI